MREVCFCGRSGDVRDSESILDDKHLKQFDLGDVPCLPACRHSKDVHIRRDTPSSRLTHEEGKKGR
jgi:hypothetical protein